MAVKGRGEEEEVWYFAYKLKECKSADRGRAQPAKERREKIGQVNVQSNAHSMTAMRGLEEVGS